MSELKRFLDFDIADSLEKERLAYERELTARKMKNYTETRSFEELKSDIIDDMETSDDFHISLGNTSENINGTEKDEFHIEYESPRIGRFKIYLPGVNEDIGTYEINGELCNVNIKDVREFYLMLNQVITTKSVVESLVKEVYEKKNLIKG